ncbi:hypothetical protein QCA50_014858 [Cerrena zonata]|uniref:Vomeronasal type-1 receptor n=1 Tax=Cerrena zonata TaxID=2478898 RepID=A0AAW0FM77_9APHY
MYSCIKAESCFSRSIYLNISVMAMVDELNLFEKTTQALTIHRTINYISVASFTLLAYDCLLCILEDSLFISLCPFKSPDAVYILSRTLAVGEAIASLATTLIPFKSCVQIHFLRMAKYFITMIIPCNAWLFMLRVRVLYFYSQFTIVLFMVLWALTFTSLLAIPAYQISSSQNPDGTCTFHTSYNKKLLSVPFLALVIFDTAVIIATSASFITGSSSRSWRTKLKSMITTKDVGHISKIFLRSGQIYYLVTIGIHLFMFIIMISPSIKIPTYYIGELSLLTCIFHNMMSCRVFRLLKLSDHNSHSSTSLASDASSLAFYRSCHYNDHLYPPLPFNRRSSDRRPQGAWIYETDSIPMENMANTEERISSTI